MENYNPDDETIFENNEPLRKLCQECPYLGFESDDLDVDCPCEKAKALGG